MFSVSIGESESIEVEPEKSALVNEEQKLKSKRSSGDDDNENADNEDVSDDGESGEDDDSDSNDSEIDDRSVSQGRKTNGEESDKKLKSESFDIVPQSNQGTYFHFDYH